MGSNDEVIRPLRSFIRPPLGSTTSGQVHCQGTLSRAQSASLDVIISRAALFALLRLTDLHLAYIRDDICRDKSRQVGGCRCILSLPVAWQRLMNMAWFADGLRGRSVRVLPRSKGNNLCRCWSRLVAAGRRALSPVYHRRANIALRISPCKDRRRGTGGLAFSIDKMRLAHPRGRRHSREPR
jgi:hypothetical protein